MKFDPDMPYVKVRSLTGVRFHQRGHVFSSGGVYMGKSDRSDSSAVIPPAPEPDKQEIRARAAEKLRKKVGKKNLEDFRQKDAPDAVTASIRENEAARQAEDKL